MINSGTGSNIVKHLIYKDIQLNIWYLCMYLVIGVFGLWLLTLELKGPFHAGSVILLSVIIITGAQLIINTITTERTDQTLTFIMSLPITFVQYTHAKICANVGAFLLFWLLIVGGVMWVIFSQSKVPDGLAVYATILMLEMLAVFVLLLFVALISESQSVTIVVMTLSNVGLSLFMFWLSSVQEVKLYMDSPVAVWNQTALTIISVEIGLIILFIFLTYVIQSRKKDFL